MKSKHYDFDINQNILSACMINIVIYSIKAIKTL